MKNRIIILSLCASCLLAIVAFVYNSETKTDPLALSPIVAKRVTTPTGTLVSCNLKALKDTVDIPLSYLTEELQVVKLDNRDEALVGGWIRTTVGEKYILVSNNKQTPYKLFTRDGKFITTIGAYGQGPNEYGNTYADQLDEAHNRIYILPWQSDKLLVFDLQGSHSFMYARAQRQIQSRYGKVGSHSDNSAFRRLAGCRVDTRFQR